MVELLIAMINSKLIWLVTGYLVYLFCVKELPKLNVLRKKRARNLGKRINFFYIKVFDKHYELLRGE